MKGLVKDVIWLLRRMKQLNVDERTITNYWKAEGRVHLETCALAFLKKSRLHRKNKARSFHYPT